MANNPAALLQQYGTKVVLSSLEKAQGQSAAVLSDEATYRRLVVDPAWELMPAPLRLIGRERLRWDEMFLALRQEVYDTRSGQVGLRSDASLRLMALISKLFNVPGQPNLDPASSSGRKLFAGASELPTVALAPAAGAAKVDVSPGAPGLQQAALGIDLGTTYSVVAHVDTQGRPWSIPNAVGDILTPSVILFDDGGPIVGKEAVLASTMEPDKVAETVKRDMGAKYYRKKLRGEFMPPEVISSFILKSLKADAERKLGPITRAVITVPAYFDEPRRRATVDAGRLAGLEVLDIINEPTAAAIAYGYQIGFLDKFGKAADDKPLRVLVFDLGGGTFDVTIVEIQGTSFKAVATDGDVFLGGKDWDEKIIEMAADRFKKQFREDPRENPATLQDLWNNAEIAKKTLTERGKATLYVNHVGSKMKFDITREEFEQATAALLARTQTTTEIIVRQAGLNWDAIDKVLLVGGSTRMPQVVRMLTQVTGRTPDRSVSPDEAVAQGAALYADLLVQKMIHTGTAPLQPRFSITNVNSHSLGIVGTDPQTRRRRNVILIPKNTPLPHAVARTFKTAKPNQRNVSVTVVEGESERPEACTQIGTCVVRNMPASLPAGWPVEVSYRYEENGRLTVSCKLKGQASGLTTEFLRDNSLPEGDMMLWAEFVADEAGRRG
jgi:molecular chaperone DnaK